MRRNNPERPPGPHTSLLEGYTPPMIVQGRHDHAYGAVWQGGGAFSKLPEKGGRADTDTTQDAYDNANCRLAKAPSQKTARRR